MKKPKKRLDALLQERNPNLTKTFIQSMIAQGNVTINGHIQAKAGTQVADQDEVILNYEQPKFVCRAGFKLEKALDEFKVDVTGLTVLDAGLSTGGFTDCLLQRGSRKVYGIDVGYGQVHEKIRADERVIVRERTNLRYLEDLGELVDLVTLDLSFISVLKVLDAVKRILKAKGKLIVLIKPQFEAERHQIGKGGIIKDPVVHEEVVQKVTKAIAAQGFTLEGVIDSPILGSSGNKEFLAYFTYL